MSSGLSLSKADGQIAGALGGLVARQRAIAGNIANVDTPGYKGSEVRFEGRLEAALQRRQQMVLARTSDRHLDLQADNEAAMMPEVVTMENSALRNDGNNVDIDREMVKLADTSIKYNAAARMVSERFSLLRSIVNEGRR